MSTPITIFGSTEHLSGDNLPPRIENLNDKVITSESILSVNPDDTVNSNPLSAYGKTLLDTTSLADLRATILENTNEEAIRLLADGNNEVNFYTGGTGASNLKLQIKDSSVEIKNGASLSCFDVTVDPNRSFIASYVGSDTGNNLNLRYGASVYQQFNSSGIEINQNVTVATNKYIYQKIEDSDSRVLLESVGKRQVCLYSYETGSNSGLLVQVDANDILAINNYKNSVPPSGAYRPISINRDTSSYLVCGASINPTSIPSNFISNGTSVFSNGPNPLLHISATNIQPYLDIIPSGVNAQDLGNGTNYFGETHTNYLDVKSHVFMDFFGSSDIKNEGFYFRSGFSSGSGIQDNMCIRAHNAGGSNDGLMVSAYGGISLNCGLITVSNDNGNDASINRAMLVNTSINNYVNMLPSADGTLNIGSASLKFADIYGNNIRAHTSLYASSVRPYSGSNVHFHNTNITTDNGYSLDVDSVRSTANNRDLTLSTGVTSRMSLLNTGGIVLETDIYPSITGQQSVGTSSNKFNLGYINGLWSDTINGNNTLELYGGFQKHLTLGNGGGTFVDVHTGLRPATSTIDIGGSASAHRFRNLYLSDDIYLTNLKPIGTNTSVRCGAHFFPELDDTYTLGGSPGGIDRLWNEIYCSNTIINTSDRRKKKDIVEINTQEALKTINRLKPVKYKWIKNQSNRTHIGYIAQDILDANVLGLKDNFAGYVKTESGSLGLRYGEFISLNTAAIQELDSKLSKLQKSSVIIHEDGETKNDVNYHTDTSALYERIETLEQLIEEMSDTIGENTIQNVIEIQSDDDRTELTEELERLSRKNDKLEETLNNNDAVIQELVNKINVLENRLKQKQDEETEESEGGINMVEMLQNRNYEMEQRMNKIEKQNKKLTSNLNKILKQLKNDTN